MEKIEKFREKNNWIDYAISPLIVIVILLCVYFIKGVYPFGNRVISYYDMTGSYIPIYSFFWDAIHGTGDIYLNWYSGLGISMADVVGMFLAYPTNIFLLFVPRDGIVYAMSFLLLIKVMLCAFTMSFYYKKHYTDFNGIVCSGVLYAFCGFAIQYYTNIYYFDLMMLFPLLIYGTEKLVFEFKYKLFIAVMVFVFFCNVQLIFMVCIYLILKVYIILKQLDKEKRGKALRLLLISVFLSLLISGIIIIPSMIQTLQASRINRSTTFDYVRQMRNVLCLYRKQKYFIMFGSEAAIGLLVLALLRGKQVVEKYKYNIFMIILLSIPIIHEGINLLWHVGSYKQFPIRFGYMLTFECIVFIGEYVKNEEFINIKLIGRVSKLIGLASIPFIAYVLYVFCAQFTEQGLESQAPYESYKLYFLTLIVVYFVCYLMETKESRTISIFLLVLIQGFCGCYGFISPDQCKVDEKRNLSMRWCIENKTVLGEYNPTKRIKANSNEFESNYSLLLQQPAISCWLYGLSGSTEEFLRKSLGYDGMESYVMDTGGTIFSDIFLGMDKVVSSENLDKEMYVASKEGIEWLWDIPYNMSFGKMINENKMNNMSSMETPFEYQNALFQSLSGLSTELLSIKKAEDYVSVTKELSIEERVELEKEFNKHLMDYEDGVENNDSDTLNSDVSISIEDVVISQDESTLRMYELNIPCDKKNTVYLDTGDDFEGFLLVMIDGEPQVFECYVGRGQIVYPNKLRNGIVSVKTIDNGNVNLKLYTTNDNLDNVTIGILDHGIMQEGLERINNKQALDINIIKNRVSINGTVNEAGTLLLPIGFSKNWRAKVNNGSVTPKAFANNALLSLDVPQGNVNIELKYRPQGLIVGTCISIIGFILFGVLIYYDKKKNFVHNDIIIADRVIMILYNIVLFAIIVVMYVIPLYIKLSL